MNGQGEDHPDLERPPPQRNFLKQLLADNISTYDVGNPYSTHYGGDVLFACKSRTVSGRT